MEVKIMSIVQQDLLIVLERIASLKNREERTISEDFPRSDNRIFQSVMKEIDFSYKEKVGLWKDYKEYYLLKKILGRGGALKELPKDSLLRQIWEKFYWTNKRQ